MPQGCEGVRGHGESRVWNKRCLKSPWLAQAQKGWQPFPRRTTTVAVTARTGEAEGRARRWEGKLFPELEGHDGKPRRVAYEREHRVSNWETHSSQG